MKQLAYYFEGDVKSDTFNALVALIKTEEVSNIDLESDL